MWIYFEKPQVVLIFPEIFSRFHPLYLSFLLPLMGLLSFLSITHAASHLGFRAGSEGTGTSTDGREPEIPILQRE